MTFNKFLELVKQDERKKVFITLENKEIEPKKFTNAQCKKVHNNSSVKVFEKLIEYGLNINFDKSMILRTALYQEKSTYANYLRIASQNGQTIEYPKSFSYSQAGDIKYLNIQKVKYLFSLPGFPMVKSDFIDYVGCIGDRYREVAKTISFQKFFDKVCPDEYFVDYFNEEMSWHYESVQNNLLKELYKRRKILKDITPSQKKSLVKTLNDYYQIDIQLLYKFIKLEILSKEEYQTAVQNKPLSPSDTKFLEEKEICFIKEEIKSILQKDINSLTFDDECNILYTAQANSEVSQFLIKILNNPNNKLKEHHYLRVIEVMTDFANINNYFIHGSYASEIMETLLNSNKVKSESIKETNFPDYTLPKTNTINKEDEKAFIDNVIKLWSHKKYEKRDCIFTPMLFSKYNKIVQDFCSEILQSSEYFISLGVMKSYVWEKTLQYHTFESEKDFKNFYDVDFNLFEKLIELKKFDLLQKIVAEYLEKDEIGTILAHINTEVVEKIKALSILDNDALNKLDKSLETLKENEKFLRSIINNDTGLFNNYVKNGWDINKAYPVEVNSKIYYPLELTLSNDNLEALDILLDYNVELNIPNFKGEYILEKAFFKSIEFCKKLIASGADFNCINQTKVLFDIVTDFDIHKELLKLFLSYNPNIYVKDEHGKTVFNYFENDDEIRDILCEHIEDFNSLEVQELLADLLDKRSYDFALYLLNKGTSFDVKKNLEGFFDTHINNEEVFLRLCELIGLTDICFYISLEELLQELINLDSEFLEILFKKIFDKEFNFGADIVRVLFTNNTYKNKIEEQEYFGNLSRSALIEICEITTNVKQLERLVLFEDENDIGQYAIKNPLFPIESFEKLVSHKSENIRVLAAFHCKSNELLKKLINDSSKIVRCQLALNLALTEEDVVQLSKDEDMVVKQYLAIHPNLPIKILEEFAKSDNSVLQANVAKNPNITIELIEYLIDSSEDVRNQIINNENTPTALLEIIADKYLEEQCFTLESAPNIAEKTKEELNQFMRARKHNWDGIEEDNNSNYSESIKDYKTSLEFIEPLYKLNHQRYGDFYLTVLRNLSNCIISSNASVDKILEALVNLDEVESKLYKQNPLKYRKSYLGTLDNLAHYCQRIDSKSCIEYYTKYFELLCLEDDVEDANAINWFIYPFVKCYQTALSVKDSKKLKDLDEMATSTITYFKNRFGERYDEQLKKEHERYMSLQESDEEFTREKYEIFTKIFIER